MYTNEFLYKYIHANTPVILDYVGQLQHEMSLQSAHASREIIRNIIYIDEMLRDRFQWGMDDVDKEKLIFIFRKIERVQDNIEAANTINKMDKNSSGKIKIEKARQEYDQLMEILEEIDLSTILNRFSNLVKNSSMILSIDEFVNEYKKKVCKHILTLCEFNDNVDWNYNLHSIRIKSRLLVFLLILTERITETRSVSLPLLMETNAKTGEYIEIYKRNKNKDIFTIPNKYVVTPLIERVKIICQYEFDNPST